MNYKNKLEIRIKKQSQIAQIYTEKNINPIRKKRVTVYDDFEFNQRSLGGHR